jgi:hypothetical protein
MKTIIFSIMCLSIASVCLADPGWPKVIATSDGTVINIYQPQPEYFSGNTLKSQSAISVLKSNSQDPVFGVFWSVDRVATDRDTRKVAIESVKVTNIKIPADSSRSEQSYIRTALETNIPKVEDDLSLDDLLASLDQDLEENKLSKDINNQLPKVVYSNQPSMLVLIDGAPQLRKNKSWGMNVVVNTPFTIVQNKNGKYYLYGGSHWYSAPSSTGPYAYSNDKVPHKIKRIARKLKKSERETNEMADNVAPDERIYNIIVSTSPEELIQSDGNPDLAPIEGTSLLYVKNSDNDIFVDTKSQDYYVLLAGRWYQSKALNSNSSWGFIPSNELPPDFAKIPEGSPKDHVLASVAGTEAAREAVMDAQIPQTAKIDRRTATTQVEYDGEPQFKPIPGTNMEYAVNTRSKVILNGGRYYAVDNGIWFVSNSPTGPWEVSTDRPDQMDEIPPSSPVYNLKYVYVYETTPDYAYMGYTPGYLDSYVYGPTVVYGTGYYYDPWFGDYYYPEPWTWGFDMGYDPWDGWGFGMGYGFDWLNMDYGYDWGGWCGGYWGPSAYRPAYTSWGDRFHGERHGGFYGRNAIGNGRTGFDMRYANNLYRDRQGVIPRNNAGRVSNFYSGRQTVGNNVFSDRSGNIYQRGNQGQWQQRINRQWAPVRNAQPNFTDALQRQQFMRERGQVRTENFQRASNFSGMRASSGGFRGGFSGSRGGFSSGSSGFSGGRASFSGGGFGVRR